MRNIFFSLPLWGHSSVGRASALQAEGRRFDSGCLHHGGRRGESPRRPPGNTRSLKTLVLVRHAKSSWKDASLPDRDRPLNRRGKRDAPEMGRRLAQLVGTPDLIVSSPAARALATARVFAEAVDYPVDGIREEERIYEAAPTEILDVIRDIDDDVDGVPLFGHNPGLTQPVKARKSPRLNSSHLS